MALLVQNMERLDEQVKEEADGIYNTLGKEMYTKALTVMLHLVFMLKQTVVCPLYNMFTTIQIRSHKKWVFFKGKKKDFVTSDWS